MSIIEYVYMHSPEDPWKYEFNLESSISERLIKNPNIIAYNTFYGVIFLHERAQTLANISRLLA